MANPSLCSRAGLREIIKRALNQTLPSIINIKAQIDDWEKQKKDLQGQIDAINIELGVQREALQEVEVPLLGLLEAHGIKKVTVDKFAVERRRNANPTVEVIDLAAVPERYLIYHPVVDKRLIQTEFVNNHSIPPGVSIQYRQYLTIIERRES